MIVSSDPPRVTGDVHDFGVEDLLQQFVDLRLTGRVVFKPTPVELFFETGDLIAARCSELLGSILLRRGAVTPTQLLEAVAMQAQQTLGEVLLNPPFLIRPAMLRDAIHIQIMRAIKLLFEDVPKKFAVFHHDETMPIHARIPVQVALDEIIPSLFVTRVDEIHMGTMLRLNLFSPKGKTELEPDQWVVATLLDGRRNVATVCQMFQMHLPRHQNPEKSVFKALKQMYKQGLVELVDYSDLDQIIVKQISTRIKSYVQQQFLMLSNGQRTLTEIGQYLGLDAPQTTEIAVLLYRHHFLEIQSGLMEFERFLEEF
jgi:hypothetical protein